jgi:phosphatidylglycerophosphate synthase
VKKGHIQQWLLAFFCYIGYAVLDNLDGKHARRTNQCSKLGAFYDHVVDGIIGPLACG